MASLTFIDLFGAPGGMSKGFRLAGMTPVGMLDTFPDGVKTYRENFPKVPEQNIVVGDASRHNAVGDFRRQTGLRQGDVDVIIGGPPCQGFSNVGRVMISSLIRRGKKKGRTADSRFIDDPRNNLYKSFIKFVRYYRPKAVVMENVVGMQSYRNGDVVRQILLDLKKAGLANSDFKVLNAADFGVPQKRKRIFFIGTRSGIKIRWPAHKIRKPITVRDAIGDLPVLRIPNRGTNHNDKIFAYTKLNGKKLPPYQRLMRKNSSNIHNHITRWHRDKDISIFSIMKQGDKWSDIPARYRKMIGYSDDCFLDKWKRLVLADPSWTIVAHLHKDGYMYIHPSQDRTISVREAARLQSFPDNFIFHGSRGSQFKQVGNAVPPILARAVARSVKKSLG